MSNGNVSPSADLGGAVFLGFDDGVLLASTQRLAERQYDVRRLPRSQVLNWHIAAYKKRHIHPPIPPMRDDTAAFADVEQQLLLTVDRVFLDPLSSGDLLRYLSWLRHFARDFLKALPADVHVIFCSTPHFPWDIVLALEFNRGGRKVFTLESSLLPNMITVQSGINFAEPDFLRNALGKHRPNFDWRAHHPPRLIMSAKRAREVSPGSRDATVWRFVRRVAERVRLYSSDSHYYSIYSRRIMVRKLVRTQIRHWRARQVISRLSVRRLPTEFIYVPLHNQPERTTDPEAGVFRYQEVFLWHLRLVLDTVGLNDWKLVVREHPSQNPAGSPDVRQTHVRDRDWYESICQIPGVVILHPSVEAKDAMQQCRLVATVNGSSAWEAVLRGKPAVTARRMWHSSCLASPTISSLTPEQLYLLMQWDEAEVVSAVESFVSSTDLLFEGVSDNRWVDGSPGEELVASMADSLESVLRMARGIAPQDF